MDNEKAIMALTILGAATLLLVPLMGAIPLNGGAALIMGTGIEDLLTSGAGIADDPLSVGVGIATVAGGVAGIGEAIVQPKVGLGS